MHTKQGFVAEGAKGLGEKTKITMPEELVGADGEVGVEKNFQSGSFG